MSKAGRKAADTQLFHAHVGTNAIVAICLLVRLFAAVFSRETGRYQHTVEMWATAQSAGGVFPSESRARGRSGAQGRAGRCFSALAGAATLPAASGDISSRGRRGTRLPRVRQVSIRLGRTIGSRPTD